MVALREAHPLVAHPGTILYSRRSPRLAEVVVESVYLQQESPWLVDRAAAAVLTLDLALPETRHRHHRHKAMLAEIQMR